MKRSYLAILLAWLFLITLPLAAQSIDPRLAQGVSPLAVVPLLNMPTQDNKLLYETEMASRSPETTPHFAVNLQVDISPLSSGTWDVLPDGRAVWRLRIRSAGAKSLNLGFDKFVMPHDANLLLYSPDGQAVMGPFTPLDNEVHEQLWTPVLAGDELVIELQLPQTEVDNFQLHLKFVNHDFLGFVEMMSGSCNLDVICGAADGWGIVDDHRDIIQSVAAIGTGGSGFCTGFLVNNAGQDCKPMFMTAFHCGITAGNAATLVTYWNFQNSTCRQPNSAASGAGGDGVLNNFNTGSIFRAGSSASDFTLVELDDPVNESADAYYAGWSAEQVTPTSAICVHHPSVDEKRISFENDPLMFSDYGGTTSVPNGDHVRVVDWDTGTTEGGSSGSPLFDQNERVVGQLHGGGAACGNDLSDYYGAFYKSWNGGGTPATRLKDWLDPDNTGILTLNGRAALQCSYFVMASPQSISVCAPDGLTSQLTVGQAFASTVSVHITGNLGGIVVDQTLSVAPGATVAFDIASSAGAATGTFVLNIIATDGIDNAESQLTVQVTGGLPIMPTLTVPANNSIGVPTQTTLFFDAIGSTFQLQIADDASFSNILQNIGGLTTAEAAVSLAANTTYFWRVKATNSCGDSEWSATHSFTTADIQCFSYSSTNVPISISANGTPTYTSTLTIEDSGNIDDLNVTTLAGTHSYMSDLRFTLISPVGTQVILLNQACGTTNDFNFGLDDAATIAMPCPPTDMLPHLPAELLASFNGENVNGTWTLFIEDLANQDGGSLNEWTLNVCYSVGPDYSIAPVSNLQDSCALAAAGTANYELVFGADFDATNFSVSASAANPNITAQIIGSPIPGGTAILVVSADGNTPQGNYPVVVTATDGVNTNSANVMVFVNNFVAAAPISPVNGTANIVNLANFTWSAGTATQYRLQLSTSSEFVTLAANQLVSIPQASSLVTAPTTYFWRVISYGVCGEADTSEVFTFSTIDISYSITPNSLTMCNTEIGTALLTLGTGFGMTTLSATGTNGTVSFSPNPADPSLGPITVTFSNFSSVPLGPEPINIIINGANADAALNAYALGLTAPPALPLLIDPLNNATLVYPIGTTFSWAGVTGANTYTLEVSLNPDFSSIVYATTVNVAAAITLPINLDESTLYYWHIIATNECGSSIAGTRSFTTDIIESSQDLAGNNFYLAPNPADESVKISFAHPLMFDTEVFVYASNGQQVGKYNFAAGSSTYLINVADLPTAMYALRLRSSEASTITTVIVRH